MPNEPTSEAASGLTQQLELVIQQHDIPEGWKPPFALSPDRPITIREDLTLEEFKEGLRSFKVMRQRLDSMMEIGQSDYIAWGKLKFGKDAVNASLAQLEFDMPTVNRALDIQNIPTELRQPNLEADHYVVLARAGLKKAKQVYWSKLASQLNLSPSQLKLSIVKGEVTSAGESKKLTHGILSIHGVRHELDIWLSRVGGAEGIKKLEPAVQNEIVENLRPFAELYRELVE